MQSVLVRIKETNDQFTESEERIVNYIKNNPEQASKLDARSLAKETYTSPSSVIRLSKKIGFSGYKELTDNLKLEIAMLGQDLVHEEQEINENSSIQDIIRKVTEQNIQSLKDTEHLNDPKQIEAIVNLIYKSKHLLLFGVGASLAICKDISLKFARVGKLSQLNDDFHMQLLQAKNATSEDCAIVITYSGETSEVIKAMEILKENNTPIILMTRFADSPVKKYADHIVYICANEPIFRMGAMSSRISQLNLVDIIYTAYISRDYINSINQISKTFIHKK